MTESKTIIRCQDGDRDSFLELFSGYRDGAYRYCLGMVGNSQTALDIVQEAFLAAFRGIHRLEPERGFGGWFYGILRHLCLATLKQSRVSLSPEVLEQSADPGPSPESRAAEGERRVA